MERERTKGEKKRERDRKEIGKRWKKKERARNRRLKKDREVMSRIGHKREENGRKR